MRVVVALVVTAATATACSPEGAESPLTMARAVFETVRDGNQAAYLSHQVQISGMEAHCPDLEPGSRSEVEAELATYRKEALEAFESCLAMVNFSGARFVRAVTSPSRIIAFPWPECEETELIDFVRIHFEAGGVAYSFILTEVMKIAGRWVYRGSVRLCEGPPP